MSFSALTPAGERAAVAAERAHRLDIAGDLARLAHRLRIIGGKDELREGKLVEPEAHPVGAPFRGMIGPGPAGDIVIEPVIEIMVERLARLPAVARHGGGAPFVALLKAADAAEIAADAAGEMRELNPQASAVRRAGRELISRTAAVISENSQPSMRPRSSASMRRPADDARQRMDEDIEIEIGAGFPERPQCLGVERLILQFRGDDDAGKAELDGAALQFGRGFRAA